jgi:hypothetical protein
MIADLKELFNREIFDRTFIRQRDDFPASQPVAQQLSSFTILIPLLILPSSERNSGWTGTAHHRTT